MNDEVICVGKQFRFEAAHALDDYEGPCKNIHGHSYELDVVVSGKPNTDKTRGTPGLVVDFGVLKQIVNEHIISKLDHKLILQDTSPHLKGNLVSHTDVVLMPFNPTCELLLLFIRKELQTRLDANLTLESLRLRETSTSFAYWSRLNNPK